MTKIAWVRIGSLGEFFKNTLLFFSSFFNAYIKLILRSTRYARFPVVSFFLAPWCKKFFLWRTLNRSPGLN